jgi:hypothetical protein
LIVALAGCGSPADQPSGTSASPPAPVTTIVGYVAVVGVEVVAVAPAPDPAALAVTLGGVPTGDGPCAVAFESSVEYEADRIHLTVRYEAEVTEVQEVLEQGYRTLEVGSPEDVCTRGTVEIAVPLDGPLAARPVVTQGPSGTWSSGVDGTYRRCELPDCDPDTGQPPPSAGCGDASLIDAVRRGDVPRRAGIDVRACELPWAVVDVDVGAGACPASGDDVNPCAGKRVDRSYWKAVDGRWQSVAYSDGPGCGDVLLHLPELPEALCAHLPPPP